MLRLVREGLTRLAYVGPRLRYCERIGARCQRAGRLVRQPESPLEGDI